MYCNTIAIFFFFFYNSWFLQVRMYGGVLDFYTNFSLHMAYVILNMNALLERVKHLTLSSQPKSHSTWLLVIDLNFGPSSKFEN